MNFLSDHKKLFLLITIAGSITLAILTYFALAPLDISATNPKSVSDESLGYISYFNKAALLVYVLLIFTANTIYRNTQKGIYLFYGWLFYTVAVLFSYIYLRAEHFRFDKVTGIWSGGFEVGFIVGFFLCLAAGTFAFINYMVLRQMKHKDDLRKMQNED